MNQNEREPQAEEQYIPFTTVEEALVKPIVVKRRSRARHAAYAVLTLLGLSGAVGGGIGFLSGAIWGFREAREEAIKTLGEDEFKVEPTRRVENITEADQNILIDWQATKTSYEKTFQEAVNFNDAQEIIKPLRQIAVNHTLYGAELLNKTFVNPQIETDYGSNKLTIDGVIYDLIIPRDFHLASAIIDSQISRAFWAREAESDNPQRREEAKKALEETEAIIKSLDYLPGKLDNIHFTEDSFLYFPTELFVSIAKITQSFEHHGYPILKTILVASGGESQRGFYVAHDQPISPFTVVIRSNTWDGGIVHEYAHFLQDAGHFDSQNKEKTTKVSLENYQKVVESAKLAYETGPTDLKNQYFTEHAMEGAKEDYADTFTGYFWYGDDFRARLNELNVEDSVAYQILQAKYDFFKNVVFEGEEFHNKGVSFNQEVQVENQIQTIYQIGDRVKIVDEDEENPGILLRPATSYFQDKEDLPAVFNGDTVEILEGPELVIYFTFDENYQTVEERVNWWRVKISHQTIESYSLVGNIEGEGWIQERWFGEKILPTQN